VDDNHHDRWIEIINGLQVSSSGRLAHDQVLASPETLWKGPSGMVNHVFRFCPGHAMICNMLSIPDVPPEGIHQLSVHQIRHVYKGTPEERRGVGRGGSPDPWSSCCPRCRSAGMWMRTPARRCCGGPRRSPDRRSSTRRAPPGGRGCWIVTPAPCGGDAGLSQSDHPPAGENSSSTVAFPAFRSLPPRDRREGKPFRLAQGEAMSVKWRSMPPLEPPSGFVMPGKNGIETGLSILDVISRVWTRESSRP